MCGLAGMFTPAGVAPQRADLSAMLTVMRHRGPDSGERWVSSDSRYQCGFARLSIIDLETGGQPLVEADGRRVLLGNGEIYNYLELRQRFADYPWQSHGDIETVLPLVDARGDDFVHDLNGMYALALYDRLTHQLTLVRDRLGVKPVYWTQLASGAVLFASEIKPLLASGLVTARVEPAAVSAYLSHGWVPAPMTLYAGINKLPPGHVLRVDAAGRVSQHCYWRPRPGGAAPASAEQARDSLLDLLDDSVRLQLRSDVPVGALLSGGIDSGLLVALAARRLDRPLHTFTMRFAGAGVDESPLAAQVAQRYGTIHTTLDLATDSIQTALPKLAWYCDEPLADSSLLPNLAIEQALAPHVRVVLNGTGGDELFAGYGRYFQLPVERRFLGLPGPLRAVGLGLAGLVDPMRQWQLARAAKFSADPGGYVHDHSCHFPPPLLARLGHRPIVGGGVAQRLALDGVVAAPQSAMLMADLATYLPEDLLLLLDRTSMAASVEGRVPFLDHRLVEAALAVPPELRTPHGRQKGLERAMAADLLPADVLNFPKQGFASPVVQWMRDGLAPLAARLLKSRRALDRGWWNEAGIDFLLARPDRHAFRLYSLIMLELCVRLHVERPLSLTAPTDPLEAFLDD